MRSVVIDGQDKGRTRGDRPGIRQNKKIVALISYMWLITRDDGVQRKVSPCPFDGSDALAGLRTNGGSGASISSQGQTSYDAVIVDTKAGSAVDVHSARHGRVRQCREETRMSAWIEKVTLVHKRPWTPLHESAGLSLDVGPWRVCQFKVEKE